MSKTSMSQVDHSVCYHRVQFGITGPSLLYRVVFARSAQIRNLALTNLASLSALAQFRSS
jgi:hypothetical protein